ncbi:MAG: hypothetical protein Q9168_006500 [Polycauliona sp. 1 TL-2023]
MSVFSRKKSSSTPTDHNETEPLVQDTDAMQRFTAIGKPKPQYKPSALGNMTSNFVGQAPQFLPQKFTDDSIIAVPIRLSALEDPLAGSDGDSAGKGSAGPDQQQRRRSSSSKFIQKLKGGGKKDDFKMVNMTRREYLMYWAKDEEGRYIGTEPEGEGRRVLRERPDIPFDETKRSRGWKPEIGSITAAS